MNGLTAIIKWQRSQRGYTQQQLAEQVGVSQRTIASWELGEKIPTDDNLDKLAAAFGCCIVRRWVGDNLQTRFVPIA